MSVSAGNLDLDVLSQRFDELDDFSGDDYASRAGSCARRTANEITVVYDLAIAQLIRNTRTGYGEGLREAGFTAIADELGF
jgi:hypothetical protein